MRDETALAAAVASAIWAGAAALAVHERRRAPRAEDEPPAVPGPLVSVIVPARDEERDIGAAVRSLRALDYDHVEIVVVDDESRDATGARAREAAGGDPRVRVIDGAPLPDGWVGKPWACAQGVAASRGEWLLFTDADVIHAPDSLGRCLALARRLGRGGLTLLPTVDTGTVAERAVMPAALVAIATFVAPGPLARRAGGRTAIAAGGYILMPRALYEVTGGHAAIRDRMVDDVCLAAAVKRRGALLVPVPAGRLARLRMYRGARDMWRGWSKNASFGAAGSAGKGLASAGVLVALAVGPAAAGAAGLRLRDARLAVAGAAGCAAQMALQRMAGDAVPTRAPYAPTLPVGLVVLAAAAARGSLERMAGVGPRWRGRRYPLAR